MTAQIVTFDNSQKCVINVPINTISCRMAPMGFISFEREMKENPGIELTPHLF